MSTMDERATELTLLRDIADTLHELLAWTRATGHSQVRETLEAALETDDKRLVYQLMDGRRGVAEIQKLSNVNVRYISEWGQEWERTGIVVASRRSSVKGRRERAFELGDFGIAAPKVKPQPSNRG